MREACLYNNNKFCSNIFENLQGIDEMNTLEFFLGGGGDESPRWGHSPRMRSGGSRYEGSLLNSFGWEFILFIKTHFYGGALTSHFMEEHSSPTSIYPVFMMTSSNGNMFRVTGFCEGEFTGDCGEFTGHRWILLTQTSDAELWCFSLICAWTGSWVNNQDAGDLRRHRAHYDVTVMWCRIVIQWSGQPWDLSAFNASLLSNFELVKRVKLRGSVHYEKNGLKFGTLLYPDYHSLKLTIFCTQRQFKFVVSDHP